METEEICALRLFRLWAKDDPSRWKYLEGRVLIHSSFGKCGILTVNIRANGIAHFDMRLFESSYVRTKSFSSNALSGFINNGAYTELRKFLSSKADLEELKLRVHTFERSLADPIEQKQQAKQRKLDILERVQERFPAIREVLTLKEGVLTDNFLELSELEIEAAANMFDRIENSRKIQEVMKGPGTNKQPALQLLAAFWYFQEWYTSSDLWSMASCSKHLRRVNPQLALEFTDLAREDIAARPNSGEARAVMTSRSAAYCDLRQLSKAENLVGYVLSQFERDFRALRVQGRVRFQLENFPGGAESFARANQWDPTEGGYELRSALNELDGRSRGLAIAALQARDPFAFAGLTSEAGRVRNSHPF